MAGRSKRCSARVVLGEISRVKFFGAVGVVAIGITRMHNPDSSMHVRVFLEEVIRK